MSYLSKINVHYVYSAVKKSKTTAKNRNSNHLLCVFYHDHAYTVALHESGMGKAIYWSMTIFNKELSRQCIVTAQIEPV